MTIDLLLPLVTGFLASFHCVGMCGPIVTGFVAQKPIAIELPESGAVALRAVRSISSHVYYNAGRVLSYGAVGAVAGAVGSVALLDVRVQQWTSVFFGLVMIVTGLFQLDIIHRSSPAKVGLIHRMLGSLMNSSGGESRFMIGMLTPLLPCGLLYAMAARAASAGSPVIGATTMGVFALGAIPALVVTGIAATYISARLRRLGTRFAAILIIVMGALTIARGFGIHTPISLPGSAEHLCGTHSG